MTRKVETRFEMLGMGFDIPQGYEVHPRHSLPHEFYHVSPKDNRESILRDGLDATGRSWNLGDGVLTADEFNNQGEDMQHDWRPEGVYLWPTLEQAQGYATPNDDIWKVTGYSGQIIMDPSVAHNWEFVEEDQAYVVEKVSPEDLMIA